MATLGGNRKKWWMEKSFWEFTQLYLGHVLLKCMLQFSHILSWYVNRASLHNTDVACLTCPQVMGNQSHTCHEMIETHQHKWPPTLWPLAKEIYKQQILDKVWTKGTLLHCWWERKLGQPLTNTVWRFLRKLKLELSHDPAILLLGTDPEKVIQKRYMHPYYCE